MRDKQAAVGQPGPHHSTDVVPAYLGIFALCFAVAITAMALVGRYGLKQVLLARYSERLIEIDRHLGEAPRRIAEDLVPVGLELEICWDRLSRLGQADRYRFIYLRSIDRLLRRLAHQQVPDLPSEQKRQRRELIARLVDQRKEQLSILASNESTVNLEFAQWLGYRSLPPYRDGASFRDLAIDVLQRAIKQLQKDPKRGDLPLRPVTTELSQHEASNSHQSVAVPQETTGAVADASVKTMKMLLAKNLVESAWDPSKQRDDSPVNLAVLGQALEVVEDVAIVGAQSGLNLRLEIMVFLQPDAAIELAVQRLASSERVPAIDFANGQSSDALNERQHAPWEHLKMAPIVAGDAEQVIDNVRRILECPVCGATESDTKGYVADAIARVLLSPSVNRTSRGVSVAPRFLDIALRLDPSAPAVVTFLGHAARAQSGEPSLVDEAVAENIVLSSESIGCYLVLAISMLRRGEVDRATAYVQLGQSKAAEIVNSVATIAPQMSRFDDIKSNDWSRLLRNLATDSPDCGACWLAVALLAMQQQDWPEAREAIEQAENNLGPIPVVKEIKAVLTGGDETGTSGKSPTTKAQNPVD